jgi:6-phosphogluconate dehydrogenase
VDIGFIGLGAMGSAVATNVVNKSGHAVTVWNRTEAKAEPSAVFNHRPSAPLHLISLRGRTALMQDCGLHRDR